MKAKDITNKSCKVCGVDKTTEHYSFDNANQRYESLCKPCKNIHNKKYAVGNRDKINTYARARYAKLKMEKNGAND
jgi:hypothetical protein